MKTQQIILLLAIIGLSTAAWTGMEEICQGKNKDDSETAATEDSAEDSASASASEEKDLSTVSCEKLAHMRSEMLGLKAFDNSACDGANSAKVEEGQTMIDEAISTSGCDVCAVYWAVLSDDSDRGMGSGCKSRKSFGKGKGGSKGGESSGSSSAADGESSAAERFLQEESAEESASVEGSSSGSSSGSSMGKSKCKRGMGKDGMGGMGVGDDKNSEKEEGERPEMTDEQVEKQEKAVNDNIKEQKMGPMMCAGMYMRMNGMGAAVAECKGAFASMEGFDEAGLDEYLSDMYDAHSEKWTAMECEATTGMKFEAAATDANLAATLAGFLGSATYVFNMAMLLAVIMTFFRY